MGRTIGENWRDARIAAGYRSPDAAVRAITAISGGDPGKQLSRGTIYAIEAGTANPTLAVMQLLADVYGTTLARIFTTQEGEVTPEQAPAELRPLVGALAGLDFRARERLIRNIAANLVTMAEVFREPHHDEPEERPNHPKTDRPALPIGHPR